MTRTRPDISVIILSFNTVDLLRVCLRTVFASRIGKRTMEVIVCDNGSTDTSLAMVRKEFPKVIIIDNKENLGFAGGNNRGIAKARGRYISLLNSDTEVQPDAIATMITYMDSHREVGASTCKLVLGDGSIDPACHRGFPTPWAAFTYFTKLEKLFPKVKLFAGYHQTYKDFTTIHEVDVISCAFCIVRREVIDRVGPLDEAYFLYGEDMDWCYRIKEAGWKITFNPMTWILHRKGKSGRASSDRDRRVRSQIFFYEYNKLFYQKNYGPVYPRVVMQLLYALFDIRIFLLKKLHI